MYPLQNDTDRKYMYLQRSKNPTKMQLYYFPFEKIIMSYFCFGWTSSFQLSWDFSSDTEFDVYCGLSSREIKDPSAHTTTEISQGGGPQKLDSNLQLLFENRKLLSVLSEEKTLDFLLLDLELKV